MKTKNIKQMKVTVQQHLEADAVMQGEYWQRDNNAVGGRGCFIGCLAHDADTRVLERQYGIPRVFSRIAEAIFERLPIYEAKQFFRDIPEAIGRDGRDLTLVPWQFFNQVGKELPDLEEADKKNLEILEQLAEGDDVGVDEQSDKDRGSSVSSSALSAMCQASVYEGSAGTATDLHAHLIANEKSDYTTARAQATERQRDTLLRLLREAVGPQVPARG